MNEHVSVLKDSTSCEGSISPWWDESVFGDWCCGEPLTRQHLVVDFTPLEEQDTEYVQQKCSDFWRLVANSPELQGFKSLPESNFLGEDGLTSKSGTFTSKTEREKTAMSLLDITEDRGMVEGAFETFQPVSCSGISREYHENEPTGEDAKARAEELRKQHVCKCCVKSCPRKKPRAVRYSLPEVKRLNNTLADWGHAHPKCRPVCKSRRREWKGQIQNTSAELLIERKPPTDCYRRWPSKVCPNGPCPLIGRTKYITVTERRTIREKSAVRICEAPVDDLVDTPYLHLAELARTLGAVDQIRARCTFCTCGTCCACNKYTYAPQDAERAGRRRDDMRSFDKRVKTECSKKIINAALMFTVSCYTFHPFIQRFVRIYRQVQVISDWLAWMLAVSCCRCPDVYPMSEATSTTHSDVVVERKPAVDPERAGSGEPLRPQSVTIDFTPTPRDTTETAVRCNQFWDMVHSHTELEHIKVHAEKSPYADVEECAPVHKKSSTRRVNKNTLPALKHTAVSQHKGHTNQHYV